MEIQGIGNGFRLESAVPGLGYVFSNDPFVGMGGFNDVEDSRLISFRDLAYARLTHQKMGLRSISTLVRFGSLVREGAIHMPEGLVLLCRESPLLDSETVLSGKDNEYGGLEIDPNKYLEQAEKDMHKKPEEREVLILNRNSLQTFGDERGVAVGEIGKNELTKWAFQGLARAYGMFLEKNRVRGGYIPVELYEDLDSIYPPFVNRCFLEGFMRGTVLARSGLRLNGFLMRKVLAV
jgi:hypothetical protein